MKVKIAGKEFEMCWPVKAIFEATGKTDLKDLGDMPTTFEQIEKCAIVGFKYAKRRDTKSDPTPAELAELVEALEFAEIAEIKPILSMGLTADVGNETAPEVGASN